MLRLAKRALMEFFTAQLGDGNLLERVKHVHGGPITAGAIPAARFPAVSVWVPNGAYEGAQNGQRIDTEGQICLEAYTVSGKSLDEAEDELLQALMSDDQTKGLARALIDKRSLLLSNGQRVRLRPDRWEHKFGGSQGDGFTFAARCMIHVSTKLGTP
jgi:hypothetical protein